MIAEVKSGPDWKAVLAQVGDDLDHDIYPTVLAGGEVTPGSRATQLPSATRKEVKRNERQRSAGAPERARTQARAWWQGPSAGASAAREAGTSAPLLSALTLGESFRPSAAGLVDAYPQIRFGGAGTRPQVQLVVEPIHGSGIRAGLVVVAPPIDGGLPSATAWWEVGIWIGPRHINYSDGYICAFEPSDGIPSGGNQLVTLLDLYSVWITRHLFLRVFGRWPGRQILHTAYERLAQHRPGELCGCGNSKLYDHCHRPLDLTVSAFDRVREFIARTGGARPRPPVLDLGVFTK